MARSHDISGSIKQTVRLCLLYVFICQGAKLAARELSSINLEIASHREWTIKPNHVISRLNLTYSSLSQTSSLQQSQS